MLNARGPWTCYSLVFITSNLNNIYKIARLITDSLKKTILINFHELQFAFQKCGKDVFTDVLLNQ